MKDITIPTRMFAFLDNVLEIFSSEDQNSSTTAVDKEPLESQQARQERKDFFLFTQVTDCETHEVIGQLADISSGGFKLDSLNPVEINKDYHFRINLDREIADKPLMEFIARSRWCKVDPADPYLYNVGYQLIDMPPGDLEIFNRMMEKYGREPRNKYRYRSGTSAW
jgi:hypothetical protein